jgi:hypothetical protein
MTTVFVVVLLDEYGGTIHVATTAEKAEHASVRLMRATLDEFDDRANTSGDSRIAPGGAIILDDYSQTSISVISSSGTQTVYVDAWN